MKILGTCKVAKNNKITLIEAVASEMKISEKDLLVFYEDNGRIVIEKA